MSDNNKSKGRVLLPSHVIPNRYDITITPDLEAFTFDGKVVIEYSVNSDELNETNHKEITLHAKELCIGSAFFVQDNNNDKVEAEEIRTNIKDTTVTFAFGTPIHAGSLSLTVAYTGFLNDQMAGFYRSRYTNIQGESKIMASTQFEALDARRAFPCVDEPAVKAVFGVALIIPSHLMCISNMPEKRRHAVSHDKTLVSFLDSPKMSTYLVAFCVGEFDHVAGMTKNNTLVKVYTPPGKAETGTFALECGIKCLELYDEFFGVPYPLPKMDMIAIPEFAMGAMENWGLVTYREAELLIDPIKASNQQIQRVCTVVAHELAHQWFGNLVTMAWWDDLWLNEGFASWCENWAAESIHPSWNMWDQYITGRMAQGMRLDALKSSHPIQVPIARAEEVEQVFDAISYCKGSGVVRMIRATLGAKAFREGLRVYMKRHAYGNTETTDLWKAWEESSDMPVRELMASWTEQMGFPLLRVIKDTWETDKVTLEVDQVWFLADGSPLEGDDELNKHWTIPIMSCTNQGPNPDMTIMREKTATIVIPLSSDDSWVQLNAGQHVPMRVLPSADMLKRLGNGIRDKTLPATDRAALLSDAYAAIKAGYMKPEAFLRLVAQYADGETDYIVWEELASCLMGLDTLFADDENMSEYLHKFARKMVLPLQESVGWDAREDDKHLTVLLRSSMIGLLGTFAYDEPNVVHEARKRFDAFMQNHEDVKTLPASMRVPVFKIILKNGGEKEYNEIKSYFGKATDNAERKHVLNSLGSTPDLKLKRATLDWAISGQVKLQDCFYPMLSVGRSSKEAHEISWQFLQEKFDTIMDMFRSASPILLGHAIACCAGGFVSREKADEIDAFFRKHPLEKCARKISQLLENMRANAKFFDALKASELSQQAFWESL